MNREIKCRERPSSSPDTSSSPSWKHHKTENPTVSPATGTLENETVVREELSSSPRSLNWNRPLLSPAYLSNSHSIVFQQLEIDYVTEESDTEMLPGSSGESPVIRIFGVTREGHSVCCRVHGFKPYFYISCPPGLSPCDVSTLRLSIEKSMRESCGYSNVQSFVDHIELVQRKSIMYYQQQKPHTFLKIFLALPKLESTCLGILDRGIHISGLGTMSFKAYESKVPFDLRFMIDCDIVGGNWIEVPSRKYKKTAKTCSYCQLELDCLYSDLVSHAAEGEYLRMAPFRILSFDIECAGRKGHFPEPKHDPVIQVANHVTIQGEHYPFVRNVITLKPCAPIEGVNVMSFETEREVLLAWRDLVRDIDPDVIIGYNICKFDLPYLIERAATLGIADFPFLGRVKNKKVQVKDTSFSSRQYGKSESKMPTIEGRLQFDLYQAMKRDYKLSSYSLNSVSSHFLSEHKEDVHHSIITDLQNGNAETRRRLAVYCLKDAYLPQRLLEKLMYIYNYVEMARVTGVPISYLLSKGQSIKVLSQLLRKTKQRNLVLPIAEKLEHEQGTYEGATVLEARAGFYEKPIATLDFASLYPSIMIAYNLCYCTLVLLSDFLSSFRTFVDGVSSIVQRSIDIFFFSLKVKPGDVSKLNLPSEFVNQTPSGETFVKPSLQKGILPEILEELITARKRAKADLKEATDPFEKAVLDGRQLALKISANSVYGFTGAVVGMLPCLEISSSVTSYGRQMIEQTKKLVEDRFTTPRGYEHNAEVIYGDTDSVMVQFGVSDVEAAMTLGREAAEYIRIETIRRDNCLLVKNLVTESLHKILIDRDISGAVQYAKNTISDLLMNRIDLSLLVITKGLFKKSETYEVKTAHVELAKRMRKRDAATAPNIGDRVPYVIIKAARGAKAYERSEDPIYVLENNIPIDPIYYLENQISKPLLRIFEPVYKNAKKDLLHGDHVRSISITTPSNTGIMRFAHKQLSCTGCKTPISVGPRGACWEIVDSVSGVSRLSYPGCLMHQRLSNILSKGESAERLGCGKAAARPMGLLDDSTFSFLVFGFSRDSFNGSMCVVWFAKNSYESSYCITRCRLNRLRGFRNRLDEIPQGGTPHTV
ncbi:unnamed protein product [Cochlearia groenlandica]